MIQVQLKTTKNTAEDKEMAIITNNRCKKEIVPKL